MSAGFQSFEFDLPDALLAQLVVLFDSMESALLVDSNVSSLPEGQGVYQLLYDGAVVYVGKTDGQAGLKRRLSRHCWTVRHRCNLDTSKVSYKAVRVYVFTAMDLETDLISHYGHGGGLPWNNSGFGSNDPGRQRDTTELRSDGFDALYPVDLDLPLDNLRLQFPKTAAELFDLLRDNVPYYVRALRRHGSRKLHQDFDVQVPGLEGDTTARNIVRSIISALPAGWQATLLPGRIIIYPENREYSAGSVIARSA